MNSTRDQRTSSIRKAAIVVGALDHRMADRLLDQMPAEQAALVRRMLIELDDVSPHEQEAALAEFFEQVAPRPAAAPAGIELDDSLARRLSLGPYAAAPRREESAHEPPFRFLHDAECAELVPFLEREHPQTIALVVAHLPPRQAAKFLGRLPAELQTVVVRRLIDIEEADPEVVREVERGLESRVGEWLRGQKRREVGLATVGKILEAADPRLERIILSNVARRDTPLAERLAPRTLTFADLGRLDDTALGAVLAAADPDLTVLALAGAPVELVERVLRRLGPTEGAQLRRAWEQLGPTRLSDVEAAQEELVRLALKLEEQRDLRLRTRPELAAA